MLDGGEAGVDTICGITPGANLNLVSAVAPYAVGDCGGTQLTDVPASINTADDTLRFFVPPSTETSFSRCFIVSGTGSTGDVMNVKYYYLQVTVTLNENGGFSAGSADVSDGFGTNGVGDFIITHTVSASQCDGSPPSIGEEVCLQLDASASVFVVGVMGLTFSKTGVTNFEATASAGAGASITTTCNGSLQICEYRTYLPAAFCSCGDCGCNRIC